MKRTIAILLTVLAVMMLIPAIALAADKKPVSIKVVDVSDLKKDTYAVGEKFSPAGLKFTVTYDDSSTETIKYSATGLKFRTTPFEIGDVGTCKVNYTYTKNGVSVACDSSDEIEVTVYKLDSISVAVEPGKEYYTVGEKFNPNLMVVTASYDPTTIPDKVIVNNYKYSPTTAFTEDDAVKGTVDITVSYTEGGITVYDTITVKVKINKPTSLKVEAPPKKTEYSVGQKLDPAGMVVVATFEDGSTKTVTPTYDKNYVFTEEDAINGTKDFLLSYTSGGITVTTTLSVDVVQLDYITLTQKPHKMSYRCGETFDPKGLVITATYTNGKEKTVTNYTISQVGPFTTADFDAGTTKTIYVNYSEAGVVKTVYFTVNLITPDSLTIIAPPSKTTYNVGESFDPTGMIVIITYSDGSEYETNAYTFSSKPFEKDDDHITIYYSDPGLDSKRVEADQAVTVNETAAMSIHMSTGSLNLVAGDTYVLTATVYPTDADYDPIKWEVATGTGIIDVDQNGQVYAIAAGNGIVKASVDCGGVTRYAYCYVCVVPKVNLTSLKFKSSTLELLLGDSTTLTPVVSPANATITSMVWKTSNSSIVSVTDSGKIKGLQVGTATISATAGGKVATCQVTVVSALSRWGIVYNCKSRVNVREKASGTSKSVGYAPYGCKYKIVGESGGWYQIQFGTEKAFIWKNYLKPISESEKGYVPEETAPVAPTVPTTTTGGLATATKVTIINCTRYVYIRKGPGTTYSKMGHATLGSTYSLNGASGDWYVVDVNGETGYIYKMFGSVS